MPILAQPTDLAPYMATIEAVQRDVNRRAIPWKPGTFAGVAFNGPCLAYAVAKAVELAADGVPFKLAIVKDEHGEGHMVVDVSGVLKGKPVTIVLDQRFEWTEQKGDLERFGYHWIREL